MTPRWLRDAERADVAVYAALAATPTPALDRAMSVVSRAADRSVLWLAAAGALCATRGRQGRRAAGLGLAALGATSVAVNLLLKPLARRHRPDRVAHGVAGERQVRMPASRSLPSGHAASAFAFTTAVGYVLPREAAGLRALAAVVAYSRVHTGVHFPGDVVLGSLVGSACAQLTTRSLDRAYTTCFVDTGRRRGARRPRRWDST